MLWSLWSLGLEMLTPRGRLTFVRGAPPGPTSYFSIFIFPRPPTDSDPLGPPTNQFINLARPGPENALSPIIF